MDIERIKTLLGERHMTFEDLASKMGKERSVVYKTITNGNPTLNFLLKLSEALGLPIDTIVNAPAPSSQPQALEDSIDGFVEVNGVVHRIRSKKDLCNLCNRLQSATNKL